MKLSVGSMCSVPAKRVLSHDGRRDLLSANTATLAAAATMAASTARRHSPISGTVHPCSSATGNGSECVASPCARNRAGALVSNALVPVPTSDKEHGRAVGNGTNNSSCSNTGSRAIDRATGTNITSKCTTVTSTSTGRGGWVRSLVGV